MPKELVDKVSVVSKLVIRYWILRTKWLRQLRVLTKTMVDQNIQSECLFCRSQYGLKVEIMESLEDLFYAYLQESGETIGNYNYQMWVKYVTKKATYRTSCYTCYEKIEVGYRLERKRIRKQERIDAQRKIEQE